MAIRSMVKAIIVRPGSVLLNRCRDAEGRALYDLQGGGQRQHEPMEQALARELMDETGYTIARARLVGLASARGAVWLSAGGAEEE